MQADVALHGPPKPRFMMNQSRAGARGRAQRCPGPKPQPPTESSRASGGGTIVDAAERTTLRPAASLRKTPTQRRDVDPLTDVRGSEVLRAATSPSHPTPTLPQRDPHPALRATFSRPGKGIPTPLPLGEVAAQRRVRAAPPNVWQRGSLDIGAARRKRPGRGSRPTSRSMKSRVPGAERSDAPAPNRNLRPSPLAPPAHGQLSVSPGGASVAQRTSFPHTPIVRYPETI